MSSPGSPAAEVTMPTGYVGAVVAAFRLNELIFACVMAAVIEVVFFTVLVRAGSTGHVEPVVEREPMPTSIAVKPVLDDLPLLKLGGKKKLRAKLPDMWKKQAPIKRYQARSAPSPDAEDSVDAIPTSEVAIGDAGVPPPDAEVAAEVDEDFQPEAGVPEEESTATGEGAPDGVEEGTETDPMKARWISEYQLRVQRWFSARFSPPSTGAPCEELKKMTATVVANIGADRTVLGYVLARPSGNATFDARVRATMDAIIGQQIPPPPPLLGDKQFTSATPIFSGQNAPCTPAASPSPAPPSPAPPSPAPPSPAPPSPAPSPAPSPSAAP